MEVSPLALLIVLALVAVGAWFAVRRRVFRSLDEAVLPNVTLGVTTIADAYPGSHGTLIGFLDAENLTAYSQEGEYERLKRVFGVSEDRGSTWVILGGSAPGEYTVATLSPSERAHRVVARNVYALSNRECVLVRWNVCVNFYDETSGQFLYSWKSPLDTHICAPGKEVCKETWQTNTATLYPEERCTGEPFTQDVTWPFCDPL